MRRDPIMVRLLCDLTPFVQSLGRQITENDFQQQFSGGLLFHPAEWKDDTTTLQPIVLTPIQASRVAEPAGWTCGVDYVISETLEA